MTGTRRRVLYLSDVIWPLLLGEDTRPYRVARDPLPPDARAVGCYHDVYRIGIILESESFDLVAEGDRYPEVTPLLESIAD